ncbi:MAG TPA: DUF1615 domain-containing protein, partial [Xanthomonadaceae bacterium]|nr:DUF1615 domain-containing protein [Xanthomonadaceae bacterium]
MPRPCRPPSRSAPRGLRALAFAACLAGLAACAPSPAPPRPEEVRARIVRLLPARTPDRAGWAADIQAAFAAMDIAPSRENLCATLAVAGQESNFVVDPPVPGLGGIALAELERRAGGHGVPALLVRAALQFTSPDGRSYADRLAAARTEQDLSRIYEDFIGSVPLGRRLLAGGNPVHTGGPMQVGIAFAEQFARRQGYPYPVDGSIRHEVFTRRGGLYFGIAHLLAYPAAYPQMLYRFADYNAGFYASRNAAFQQAVQVAAGIHIPLDGDLVRYDGAPAQTEAALRTIAWQLQLDEGRIHRALEDGESPGFEQGALYERVFALAEQHAHHRLPRAILPRITLESPKITRHLTTA